MNSPVHRWNPDTSYGAAAIPAQRVATADPKKVMARIWQMLNTACWRLWAVVKSRRAAQRRRSLRVVETVAMGEKRFVAIVQVEQQRFLVGGGSAGVSLLAKLDASPDFAAAFDPPQTEMHSADRIVNDVREAW